MKAWFQRVMYGRYGQDDLGRFLPILALIFYIAGTFTQLFILTSLGIILLILSLLRMFSRNTEKRSNENAVFLRSKGRVTGFFRGIKTRFSQRKTHRFYKCPSCKQVLRVPKGKSRITIKCSKCGTAFVRKT
jgi:LSD1 subclass zinc finger protein